MYRVGSRRWGLSCLKALSEGFASMVTDEFSFNRDGPASCYTASYCCVDAGDCLVIKASTKDIWPDMIAMSQAEGRSRV